MKAYLDTLRDEAEALDVSLLEACKRAGMPTSTYYRTVNGSTELKFKTAERILYGIRRVHALRKAREDSDSIRRASI